MLKSFKMLKSFEKNASTHRTYRTIRTTIMRIKKGDQIQVIAGKNKGKKGPVVRVLPVAGKIVAENINIVKKHMKPKKEGEKGQIVETAAPFDVSNAMLVCPECGKTTRVSYSIKGKDKARVCKKCKKEF